MNRRGVFARSCISSPAIMLAVGIAALAPGKPAPDVTAAGTTPAGTETRPAIEPMRGPLPRDLDPAPALAVEATVSWPPKPIAALAVAPQAPLQPRIVAGGGRFAYGYCTWWVASRRPIPWSGNAWQWWGNARAYGMAEGSMPRPGAIMVMGISRTSPQGHVAYVESVNGDGSFTVSEMNWWGVPGGGWGRVDYRRVTSLAGVIGFIY